ncbi:MAG: transposase [Streptosporangiaceae bacterium]
MASSNVSLSRDAAQVAALLDLPEITQLIADLEETRWTGRPGFPIRVMVGAALIKAVYCLPTWTRTARLTAEHAALREAIGGTPSNWACYRFAGKLRLHEAMLTACTVKVLATLREAHPEMGKTVAIDGSDMPAYANGHKHVGNSNGPLRTRYADPDAGWGHRSSISTRKGGAFYGFKLHMAMCTRTELPLAWTVTAANGPEQGEVAGLRDSVLERGFAAQVAVLDKGYDGQPMHDVCESRGIRPVIAIKETPAVKAGKHKPPSCDHGEWTFAGADAKRGATKWRCPAGECQPASVWIKADRLHPLIPLGTERWKSLYRQRASVERGFGRLKNEYGLLPLRVRRVARVALHASLTILAQLASALLITRDT